MVERLGQTFDPAPVDVRDVGMDNGNVLGSLRQAGFEFVLFGFKLGQPVEQRAVKAALFDDADNLFDGLVGVGERMVWSASSDMRRSRLRLLVPQPPLPGPSAGRAGRREDAGF